MGVSPENARGGQVIDRARIMNDLNRLQDEHGFIPEPALLELAERYAVSETQMQGLVSFFGSFRTKPPGRHRVAVCRGTACHARGASVVAARLGDELDLDADGTSTDGLVTVEQVGCVGLCSCAPVLMQDGTIIERAKSYQVPGIIQKFRDADAARDVAAEKAADGAAAADVARVPEATRVADGRHV